MPSVDVLIKKSGHWMDDIPPNEVAAMTTEERVKYDARWQPMDIVDVYEGGRIHPAPDFGGAFLCLHIEDLDLVTARQYIEEWKEQNGVNADGEPIMECKRRRKFSINYQTLPTPIKTQIDESSYISINWEDIRGYVLNKLTDVTGV